ncbi:ABC transporter ATP-binding protein [Halomarina salina]|uniref:ABC transporter ATP-binding protein n=1 Tax=Halomarina salina TaxID=1872699 RepID=A0ABD5RSU7_9EURY|nr:ABC transporter ATP-binding protein [Halomarina salina]
MTDPLLDVDGVVAGYNEVPVLKDVDLHVDRGEVVGLIGPNGAGKSTVFKTVMGYLSPWEGEIRYDGERVGDVQPSDLVKLGIGYVPQTQNTFPKMDVMENLRMGAYTVDGSAFEERAEDLLELFPRLDERRHQQVRTMSGGEQKMVAVARALIADPDLVLFDEPSAGLMPKYVQQVFDRIGTIREERNLTFLIIEQNVPVLLENTDRTYVLRNGEVVGDGASERFLEGEELGDLYLGGSTSA